jgi:hypothetical protein
MGAKESGEWTCKYDEKWDHSPKIGPAEVLELLLFFGEERSERFDLGKK